MRRTVLFLVILGISSAVSAAEKGMFVPTDSNATYTILETGGKWPNRTIVTKRVGSSGTSYSKRLYNCSTQKVKYLGSGDSLAEMAKSNPDPKMGPIVSQSIADFVGRQACKR